MNSEILYLAELPENLSREVISYTLMSSDPVMDANLSEEEQLACIVEWYKDESGEIDYSVWCGKGSEIHNGTYLVGELEQRVWECFCMLGSIYEHDWAKKNNLLSRSQ